MARCSFPLLQLSCRKKPTVEKEGLQPHHSVWNSKTALGEISEGQNRKLSRFSKYRRDVDIPKNKKITEDLIGRFKDIVERIKDYPSILRSSEILMHLTNFSSLLSLGAQVNASTILLQLSKQLLEVEYQNNSPPELGLPAAINFFHMFDNLMKGVRDTSKNTDSRQLELVLEASLEAMMHIHTALLQGTDGAQVVIVSSSTSSTIVSRQDTSALHATSYTTPAPATVQITFPSKSSLQSLISRYPQSQVQVTAFTFNPFEYISNQDVVGNTVNVILLSHDEVVEVSNLTEDIEIILSRQEIMEPYTTQHNMSVEQVLVIAVNVTSEEDTFIVQLECDPPLPFRLYLGFQYQPNATHFDLTVTLPRQGKQHAEETTWVLSPDLLSNKTGLYHLTAAGLNGSAWRGQTHFMCSLTTFTTRCLFWNKSTKTWEGNGCHVGPRTTVTSTQCFCNHLTFFGSTFFIMPRTVDLRDTARLFANVSKNPVGVAFLGSILGIYLLIIIWARKKDKQDKTKAKVTVLADNDAVAHFRHLVQVFTGNRRGAATTSKVVITLYGTEGQSEPHHLTNSTTAVFERGGVDIFLLKTRFLGKIHCIRLWHDNSGSSPSWYVNHVVVTDLQARRKKYFLCECWLAIDLEDCHVDKIFPAASETDLMCLRHVLSRTVERLLKDHLWFSVLNRCPWSPFTRVQRVSCCLTLLICNMLINILFWDDSSNSHQLGPFLVTVTQLKISIQATLILFPANLLIVQMFHLIQVRLREGWQLPNKPRVSQSISVLSDVDAGAELIEDMKENVKFLYHYMTQVLEMSVEDVIHLASLSELMKTLTSLIHTYLRNRSRGEESPYPPENGVTARHWNFLCFLHKMLETLHSEMKELDLSSMQQPYEFIHATGQLQHLLVLLESKSGPYEALSTRVAPGFPVPNLRQKTSISSYLPTWFPHVCWIFLFSISAFSAFYLILLSLNMSKEKTTSWLLSMLLSLLESVFLVPPVKVFLQTLIFSRVLKSKDMMEACEERQLQRIVTHLGTHPDWELSGWRDQKNPIYKSPDLDNTGRCTILKKKTVKEKQLYQLITDIIVHVLFLSMIIIMSYAEKSPNEFYLNQSIQRNFKTSFEQIKTLDQFFTWTQATLLPNLYGMYQGYITDGNSFLMGSARIRQLRVKRNPDSSYGSEDTEDHGPYWTSPTPNSTDEENIWHYQTQEILEGYPIWAKFAIYSGAGYTVDLGTNRSTATRVLEDLRDTNWLDGASKAIFVEFNVYNGNTDLFCITALILENNGIGSLLASSDLQIMRLYKKSAENVLLFCVQGSFLLLLLFSVVQQGLRLKVQKIHYFSKTKNLVDLSIILISFCSVAIYVKRIVLQTKDVQRYHQNRSRFVSFYETATIERAYIYLMAFLVSLATIKLWSLLQLNPKLHLITMTLRRIWQELSGFLFIILLLLVAYSIACNLVFGWSVSHYKTFINSAVTIVSLLIGIFNYDEVLNLDPFLGSLLITTCVIFFLFVVVNLFLSAMLMVFYKERNSPTASEEQEIVALMLQKLSSWFGIKWSLGLTERQTKAQEQVSDCDDGTLSLHI
ncbi:polycystic kidney disease protein 1-like 3 [Microcaecilia unicolor]|uniref:Polycystic kidney disease protein 1-like 3 n=1 Tax=Microcaecilia unicolor TaxID=1415580 RepID=A0A6P7YDP5_9AMPH|nr:polycystic kidney disease protein 1-like 3 [Microcaecilia unicolor]